MALGYSVIVTAMQCCCFGQAPDVEMVHSYLAEHTKHSAYVVCRSIYSWELLRSKLASLTLQEQVGCAARMSAALSHLKQ